MERYPEIDALRGFALVCMAVYHLAYDLVIFGVAGLAFWEGFWWWFPRCIAAAFVTLAGLSMALRKARTGAGLRPFLARGLRLAAVAAGISAVTYLALGPGTFVFFGVIHLIAFATLVSYPLADRPAAAAALGAAVLAGGLALGSRRFPGPALAWLGLRPEGYHPADYLPVLPWYAWFLFGIAVAALLYPRGRRSFEPPRTFLDVPPIRALAWLGRRSLAIYLIHLPVLYGIVWGITRAGVAGR
ncbi:MAG TPA: heparan-alpha-glucosaminide N-acetyltransferase [Spirochaetia bacterium]|nr:heparan-alpha-glucosaminide N-acetyltransferase [Spirochaetales bacterium]HRY79385.1 heparan-alpha-glucosaminide N-acetyltransferase [Spirochaetia bacterium]HRZ90936.1 heparan-alpha-glucosaminide N-acetyltransferase [Spirochaetia bacterium]